jgi:hypothetical protein
VTNKTEHESGPPAGAPDESENPDTRAVPSIIVDPTLAAFMSESDAHAVPIRGSGQDNGTAAQAAPIEAPSARPPPDAAGDQNELSAEDAERFAASIRPSWQPPEGKDYGNGAAAALASTPLAPGVPAPARLAPADEDSIEGLPGSERKRGLMITTAAVVSFFALAALGIATSRTDVPAASRPSVAAPKTVVAPPKLAPPNKKAAPAAPAMPAPAPVPTTVPAAPEVVPAPPSASPAPAGAAAAPSPTITAPPAAPAPAPSPSPLATPPAAAGPQPMPPLSAVTLPPSHAVASVQTKAAAHEKATEKANQPATVHVQILARPKHARLTLDGSQIPNPFEADVVKGGKHRVQAHADGHRSSDLTISFDRDRDLELKLDPIGAAARAKKARTRTRASAQQASPAPRPAKPAAATAPARGAGFVSESPY